MKTFLYHENGWRMFQAEALPVKPNDLDRGLSNIEHLAYVVGLEQYESEIAALKSKSIPVGNPEIFDLMEYGTKKREWIKGYHITGKIYEWPGDVEIMMQEMGICNGFRYMEVAILTLPKEPQQ